MQHTITHTNILYTLFGSAEGIWKKEQMFNTGLQFSDIFLESSFVLFLSCVVAFIVFVDKYIIFPRKH